MARKSKAQSLVDQVAGEQSSVPAGFKVVSRGGNPLAEVGDIVTGTYQGKGKAMKIGKKVVPTYIVGGQTLLASFQIADFLDAQEEGTEVWIRYDGQVKGGKGRVNRYTFAVAE